MIFRFARHNMATTVYSPGAEVPVWPTSEVLRKMRDWKVKAISLLRDISVNSLKNEETQKNDETHWKMWFWQPKKGILTSDRPDWIVFSWRRSWLIGSVSISFNIPCHCLELSGKTQDPEPPILCRGSQTHRTLEDAAWTPGLGVGQPSRFTLRCCCTTPS